MANRSRLSATVPRSSFFSPADASGQRPGSRRTASSRSCPWLRPSRVGAPGCEPRTPRRIPAAHARQTLALAPFSPCPPPLREKIPNPLLLHVREKRKGEDEGRGAHGEELEPDATMRRETSHRDRATLGALVPAGTPGVVVPKSTLRSRSCHLTKLEVRCHAVVPWGRVLTA
jgi:hypothetical protein